MLLYNFLSRKVEEFKPIGKTVGLYTCGPTVYDFVHIGNWRTFVFEDILKRVLTFNGFEARHVMNITDIEDKIFKKANEQKVDYKEITSKFEKAFFNDLMKLNILAADFYPRASDSIDLMIDLIKTLLDKGYAYKADDGVYFSVEKFKDYGKLSGLEKSQLKKGARVNDDEYDKENWADFALWKFPSTSLRDISVQALRTSKREGEPSWPAPFGEGRPGWHIECSAMSMAELGETFDPAEGLRVDRFRTIDIHAGGVDLLFPHHENEIAQSEAATGKEFVRVFAEGEHLLIEGQKMAKSLGNIFTIGDVIKNGFEPLALRYLFLTAHYRSKLNFTWESLKAAQNALDNLKEVVASYENRAIGCAQYEGDFREAVNNDLDMPKAVAIMWEMVKSNYPTSAKHQSILVMDKVLGLGLSEIKKAKLPKGAKELIEKREKLREDGKFSQADKIRKELKFMGVEVEDTESGPVWKVTSRELQNKKK